MKLKIYLSALFLSCCFTQVGATENLYTVATLGYGKTELIDSSVNKASYKLAVGYQFDRQWYVEAGMQKLVSDSLAESMPSNDQSLQDDELRLDASALFIAWLGKASGNTGELFYRIGLLKTDIQGQQSTLGIQECELGSATLINNSAGDTYTYCEFDEGGIAGVIGLGFDYFITSKAMLRTEIEYIKGQNNLEVSAAYVGLRYNF
ncbi:outer membrane beta-barrel protein [Paraglaciecola sp.]|uniref:outer membrane beta-barrel protein n=1 Tax=Paraglaciecola sp. TaxID=1920173 RepID=UPI0030F3A02F